ncbi:hypothetical protein TTHERM_000105259 (macronuclear) [Tetrahymena thermophila SB210]|uniref:Kinase domain protein n=1 Tax=Tetrahymena thermophila (strain SB210) TaxID=312017 RepID=W7XD49_TETTS|nr:hypothetical protein TTHERM_000105259 [Tetrahymena thermophila SB210]EWS75417.1 hypothetical protein TTHERM_000105259 [Tetrahymena thermophila SB210]|eukprot:XP_012652091.1 hypothetical protein TTHERM_000105259 [Tetrahymena thermophila SB210]
MKFGAVDQFLNEKNTQVQSLQLFFKQKIVSAQIAKQITNKLQQFRYLKYLEVDISENPQLCYYGLSQFGDSIKLQMNLTTLELNMKNGFTNSYQVIEFLNQVKQCASITTMTLNLRANFISEDVKDLAFVISQFQNLKTLKLDLSQNQLLNLNALIYFN